MEQLREKIKSLKKEKNALILAHYYQSPEIQEIADYVGDSYYLNKISEQAPEELIVFCGVRFMAESSHILSPHKKILLPAAEAGCPMANMASANRLKELKEQNPHAAAVCYINTPADVKALCDVCVTSSNALKIIRKLPQKQIIFLPDQNLASYIAGKCPEKEFIIYPGYCAVHNKIMPEDIAALKSEHPNAMVAAHPECRKEVLDQADFIGSTQAILQYTNQTAASDLIIVTEEGIRYALEKQNPDKKFYFPRQPLICVNMKKISLENVLWSLEDESVQIRIDEEIRIAALSCLREMHRMGDCS